MDGWCRPLDAHEFAGKGFANIGRWPIQRTDLDPHLPGAMEILEIGLPEADVPLKGGMLRKIDVSFSPPVRFAAKYRDEILASDHIFLCVNSNLTRMEVADGAIASIAVEDYQGASATIKATTFILACGGIENSRMLLWCNAASGGALKGQGDLAGRYWFEHHHATIGDRSWRPAAATHVGCAAGQIHDAAGADAARSPRTTSSTACSPSDHRRHGRALLETWYAWRRPGPLGGRAMWNGRLCAPAAATAGQEPR
jgi:hypothetical protein